MNVSVFVPAHITGFFSICENEDILKKGSLGVGVLLNKGVITEISYDETLNDSLIKINGQIDERNQTIILKVIELMKEDFSFDIDTNIFINQIIEVPIGCGFGTSAASAVGTAICLNTYFNLGLSIEKCGEYAHIAEITLGSGLGDVIAELSNGIVIRTKPGAPGTGEVKSGISLNNLDKKIYVLTQTLGEIATSSIIQDEGHKKVITKVGLAIGEKFLDEGHGLTIGNKFKSKFNLAIDNEFNEEETIKRFMKYSYEFSKKTQLITDDLIAIVHSLQNKTLGASMAMLGNTVFALLTEDQRIAIETDDFLNEDYCFYELETKGIKISKF